jgi:hypothetical protein
MAASTRHAPVSARQSLWKRSNGPGRIFYATGIEDAIKKVGRASARCSEELIAFRNLTQQLLDLLNSPPDPDPAVQQQKAFRIANLLKQWQKAMFDLLNCLDANTPRSAAG